MPAYIMQFRRRIGMLLLAIVLLLSIALVALFLVDQPTVSSNDPYSIYKEQNYLNVLSGWYNYSDPGEL
jgi:predicted Abi (CAAX) family protease